MEYTRTKRLANKAYSKPTESFQSKLSNQEIKDKLKEYKKVDNIMEISIGTHIRYFTIDPKTKETLFRLGGTLNKIDPEGRFIILSNGSTTWSVQIASSDFYRKMLQDEINNEIKKELKKEILTEEQYKENEELVTLKKNYKILTKKYSSIEADYSSVLKKNEMLTNQINQIEKDYKAVTKKNDFLSNQLNEIEIEIKKMKSRK